MVSYLILGLLGQVDSVPQCESVVKELVGIGALDWLVCV